MPCTPTPAGPLQLSRRGDWWRQSQRRAKSTIHVNAGAIHIGSLVGGQESHGGSCGGSLLSVSQLCSTWMMRGLELGYSCMRTDICRTAHSLCGNRLPRHSAKTPPLCKISSRPASTGRAGSCSHRGRLLVIRIILTRLAHLPFGLYRDAPSHRPSAMPPTAS
jgi:hypothetical protein